jgi:tRNA threonylcarbamoyl adenosine modification protein YeaZ
MQIAIDTSTETASLALVKGDEILAEFSWHCGLNHTVEMYPRLDFMLRMSGMDVSEADCIFVAQGPGSFNGLRVGVSAAKGLALGLGIPIIGISTLEITAYQHSASGFPVCAVQNAGREEIAVALYRQSVRGGWSQISAAHITTPDALTSEIKEKTIFCGEFNAETGSRIKKILKTQAIMVSAAGRLRRAAFLAELGQKRRLAGEYGNLAAFQPTYLRHPPITERKKP